MMFGLESLRIWRASDWHPIASTIRPTVAPTVDFMNVRRIRCIVILNSPEPTFPIWVYLNPLQARNVAYCNSMRPPRV